MAQLEGRLRDFLEPLRDHSVGALLQALAEAIAKGGELETEPIARDPEGAVRREGPLALPWRGDLAVTRGGRRLVPRIEHGTLESFEPITLVAEGGFTTVLAPFPWERAECIIEARQPKPDWTPVRLWYLEWFQPRVSDVGPELSGVLHRLDGPRQAVGHWTMEIDFGSAPADCVAALIAAVGQTGALRLRLGQGC